MQTCLQIIQSVAKRLNIPAPTAAFSSQDQSILQLVELCNEEGQLQANRYQWQVLQKEATFTTVAAQIQSTLASITTGLDYIVNETIWNRTLRRPVYGPRTQQAWQQQKAIQLNGPFNSYRIINDVINFYPNPAAGQLCYFEYITKNWVTTATGTSSTWTSDTDTPLLDDQLITLGLIWRWKAAKGLEYSEDYEKYESLIMNRMSRDGVRETLNMAGTAFDIQPVVLIPAGNWNV